MYNDVRYRVEYFYKWNNQGRSREYYECRELKWEKYTKPTLVAVHYRLFNPLIKWWRDWLEELLPWKSEELKDPKKDEPNYKLTET